MSADRVYVSIDPYVKGGTPCIGGTRLPVRTLADFADLVGDAEALLGYPSATPEHLVLARWFVAAYPKAKRPSKASRDLPRPYDIDADLSQADWDFETSREPDEEPTP